MALLAAGLTACGGGGSSSSGSSSATTQSAGLSATAALGEKIFKDPSLSLNGNQSCASCHDADRGHAGPLATGVTEPGSDGSSVGGRVAPSIRYMIFNKAFRFEDGTPTGGFFWDGRAATLSEQGKGPFLNPREMANADVATVIAKLASATYANEFKALYGQTIFNDPAAAFDRVALALQAYQKEDGEFAPFSSKYDAFLRGQASLSASELRGLALFNSSAKGNCAACHPSAMGKDGSFPLFTDFSYDALGVPRNWAVAGSHGDLGLCANDTGTINALATSAKDALCGKFKVPSLRNVGLRKAFFHNGRFTSLTDVVTFYVQRDVNPDAFYLDINGLPDVKFNDLPEAYRGNVNVTEGPYNRQPGDSPALNSAEINDLVDFLCTLTDNWPATASDCRR
ncbi:MAG TPA: cytochrome c peroxidase [Aquabacterium sp.]|uniref:cytochrome-c peroxidase n=1 Tax=Aquabacterium sp. TaxID=1872578 RepID=UPI002E33AC1D|nr:cytochrome c peroxidase [Aquabacterium sp.]HEX5354707.1 cytochrome c peroxidase [Aquabacterium sp.]